MSARLLVGCDWCGAETESNYGGRPNDLGIAQVDGEDICKRCQGRRSLAIRTAREEAAPRKPGPCPHMPSRLTPCLECERTGVAA